MKLQLLNIQDDFSDPKFKTDEFIQLLEIYKSYYSQKGFYPPWVAYLVMDDEKVLGTCSFTEKPNNGIVEIAYWTFKQFEGQGVASFACKALLDIADKSDHSVQVTAKTAPEHNASTKILEKNGFIFSEVVQDDDIGDAWLWKKLN